MPCPLNVSRDGKSSTKYLNFSVFIIFVRRLFVLVDFKRGIFKIEDFYSRSTS